MKRENNVLDSTSKNDDDINSTPVLTGDAVPLDCIQLGLPCTPDEVDPEILERTNVVYQELKMRLTNGALMEEARAWLAGLDDMRIVLANPYGLIFILEGGLPVGVYDAVAATAGDIQTSAD